MKIPASTPPTPHVSMSSPPETSRVGGPVTPSAPVSKVVFSNQRDIDGVKAVLPQMRTSPNVATFRSQRANSAHQLRQSMERQFGGELAGKLFNDRPLTSSPMTPKTAIPTDFGSHDS